MRGVKKKGPRTYYKHVLEDLVAQMHQAQEAIQELLLERDQQFYREQVLVDTIMQLEEVISFKADMKVQLEELGGVPGHQQQPSACEADMGQQQQSQHHGSDSSSRYVTSLLCKVQPETVQALLSWSVEDWHKFVDESSKQLSILLDLIGRTGDTDQDGAPASYIPVAHQQLSEVVDSFVITGSLGCIYADKISAQIGACNAINHITMQQEAPPPLHWQHVVQKLQLTNEQLVQLAAGYQQLMQARRLQQQAQHAVANLVGCHNSCSVQVQAAAKEALEAPEAGSSDKQTWDFGGLKASDSQQLLRGRAAACAGAVAAAAGSDAAGSLTVAEPDLDLFSLLDRLLSMWHQSTVTALLLLFNTLTREQIARMAVASFPFVPRPAPLLEAAIRFTVWSQDTEGQPDSHAQEDTSGDGLWTHAHQRTSFLRQQHGRWWQDYEQQQQRRQQQHSSIGA